MPVEQRLPIVVQLAPGFREAVRRLVGNAEFGAQFGNAP